MRRFNSNPSALNGGLYLFTKVFLYEVKRHALRKRVWWSAIDGLERSILTLAAHVIDDVKSALLKVQLTKIITKLTEASLGRLTTKIRDFGEQRAREISLLCTRLGSDLAGGWINDDFARYLAFMNLNTPTGWK
jgi:hypothetical protein